MKAKRSRYAGVELINMLKVEPTDNRELAAISQLER